MAHSDRGSDTVTTCDACAWAAAAEHAVATAVATQLAVAFLRTFACMLAVAQWHTHADMRRPVEVDSGDGGVHTYPC